MAQVVRESLSFWSCKRCTLHNPLSAITCSICGAKNEFESPQTQTIESDFEYAKKLQAQLNQLEYKNDDTNDPNESNSNSISASSNSISASAILSSTNNTSTASSSVALATFTNTSRKRRRDDFEPLGDLDYPWPEHFGRKCKIKNRVLQ